jgi:hypothetical protein
MKTAIVLGAGPSLTQEQIDAALKSGHFTIVVNSIYEMAPRADILYCGDFLWWKVHIAKVRAIFKGALWTQDSSAAARWPDIKRMRGTNREGLGRRDIHNNGNSGIQAINLAFLWGYKRIILLGFDMKLGPKGEKHCHPDHPAPLVQGQLFGEWLHKLEPFARDLKAEGIEVIDCTVDGAIKCFPKADWREVLK